MNAMARNSTCVQCGSPLDRSIRYRTNERAPMIERHWCSNEACKRFGVLVEEQNNRVAMIQETGRASHDDRPSDEKQSLLCDSSHRFTC